MINLLLLIVWLFQGANSAMEDRVMREVNRIVKSYYPADKFKVETSLKWMPSVLSRVETDKITTVSYIGNGTPLGNSVFTVNFSYGQRIYSQNIQAIVTVKQHLPVLNQRMKSGDVIVAKNIEWVWISLNQKPADLITDAADLDSVLVTGIINAGEPVKKSEIKPFPLIPIHQTVQMQFEQNGIRIHIPVRTREDGAKNGRIKVWSEATQKNYLVTIISKDLVKWESTF
jgi:flagella basal body P-ring formation protein FlgA